MFWPSINGAIDEMISQCSTCQKHQRSNQREHLIPQQVPERPWATVAADIFYCKGRDYLLVVDYYSKYPEVARLTSKNSEAVISAMNEMFVRHGIPERLIADNMPFSSLKFKNFASAWEIEVVTSSPQYLKSNGLVERNVQTIKLLLKKADESKQDAFLALLEFRNSPNTGTEKSPAELLKSRKMRTRLPTPKYLLKPIPRPTSQVRRRLRSRQRNQKNFYYRSTRPLPELHQGEAVRIQQGREWKPAVVVKQHVAPRSYIVAAPDGTQMRKNRVHLQQSKEAAQVVRLDLEPVSNEPSPPLPQNTEDGVEKGRTEPKTSRNEQSKVQLGEPPLRRSQRVRRAPQRLIETFVASLLS